MFSHLTLLNHHKRIHTQDGTDGTNDQQITVVTQQAGQNLVQGNNFINDNEQNLAQNQIVATATAAMDQQVQGGDHQQHHHHQQQVSIESVTIRQSKSSDTKKFIVYSASSTPSAASSCSTATPCS